MADELRQTNADVAVWIPSKKMDVNEAITHQHNLIIINLRCCYDRSHILHFYSVLGEVLICIKMIADAFSSLGSSSN